MSAETVIVTATTIAVRALIDGLAALREGAKADERAEIERMLAGLHASAPLPIASSLDSIRDHHLGRVRPQIGQEVEVRHADEWELGIVTHTATVNGQTLVSASASRPGQPSAGPHVTSFWGDRIRAK
jgi:hypothetical protein